MSNFESKLNKNLKNIWRYAAFYPPVQEKFRLTVSEGWTPEIEIKLAETGSPLIFKREDLNPNGSHKDRGLAYQVSAAYQAGEKNLIISSSGNAAISAAACCQLAAIKLFVFVSSKIELAKLNKILENRAIVIVSRKSLTFADYASHKFKIKNIKASADENSSYAYKSIGFEIFEHLGIVDSIFLPVSSGSTLLGISRAYKDLVDLKEIKTLPQFHIVQTSKIHPLASHFDRDFKFEKESLAKAIVAREIPKEKEIIELVCQSGGSGWVVQNSQIKNASEVLSQNGIKTSYESAAALAGIYKAKNKRFNFGQKVVSLLTGRTYRKDTQIRGKFYKADSEREVDEIINKILE